MANHAPIYHNSYYALLSITPTFLVTPQTTPSIFMANSSPPSSGNHRSLFVKPAKRGKQRAGGEALFALHYFTFYYQQYQYHQLTSKQLAPFPRLTTPLSLRRGAGGEASYALHYFILYYQPYHHHNWFTTQLGTSCPFDSPGLASDSEVYPGSFAVSGNNAVGVVPFIYCYFITTFHAENVQHLRR